ncbi:MAG: DUF2079 domain-containing protein [Clostridiales bacterium]|nr:DUF2079 domain-containing protein [Clostridiales bacterium]
MSKGNETKEEKAGKETVYKAAADRAGAFFSKNICSILASGVTAYIIASVCNMLFCEGTADKLEFITEVNGLRTLGITAVIWIFLCAVVFMDSAEKRLLYSVMLAAVIVFGYLVVKTNGNNVYLTAGVSAVVCFFVYYIVESGYIFKNRFIKNYKAAFFVVAAAFLAMSIILTRHTIYRYMVFSASNFDFGIFAQLFENMAKTGSTVISVERNEMLSHFFNHFSPIYYVLLPIYMIFRIPEALLGIQAVFICGSAFPMFLIGKKYGLTPIFSMLLGLTVIVLAGFVAPAFYDFHENKFLPFFLLWFIYFFMDKKYIPAYIFMFLTLMIKEDAALYVIFVYVFFMLVKKNYKYSLIGLGLTFLYFVPVLIFMRKYGLDFVGWRYGVYFMEGQNKIGQMVLNIVLNPAFFIKNVFSEECVIFIIYMLGSLVFIPLVTKDFKKLVLLVPFVAINIMTDYKYQHDIGFQYTYGSLTLMLLLFADNISVMSHKQKKTVLLSALAVSFIMMTGISGKKFESYAQTYENNRTVYEETEAELDRIPEGVSITSNTYILPHLYDHEELYMMGGSFEKTDYFVLNKSSEDEIDNFTNSDIYSEYEKCIDGSKIEIYKLKGAKDLLAE